MCGRSAAQQNAARHQQGLDTVLPVASPGQPAFHALRTGKGGGVEPQQKRTKTQQGQWQPDKAAEAMNLGGQARATQEVHRVTQGAIWLAVAAEQVTQHSHKTTHGPPAIKAEVATERATEGLQKGNKRATGGAARSAGVRGRSTASQGMVKSALLPEVAAAAGAYWPGDHSCAEAPRDVPPVPRGWPLIPFVRLIDFKRSQLFLPRISAASRLLNATPSMTSAGASSLNRKCMPARSFSSFSE